MAVKLVRKDGFPTYIALSTDVVAGKAEGANIVGGTVYLTDVLDWRLISADLTLVKFYWPVSVTAQAALSSVSPSLSSSKSSSISPSKSPSKSPSESPSVSPSVSPST